MKWSRISRHAWQSGRTVIEMVPDGDETDFYVYRDNRLIAVCHDGAAAKAHA